MKNILLVLFTVFSSAFQLSSQNSIAREWNDVNLEAVRLDFAQPTLTARNLWHVSAAMYDAWAVYDLNSETYFLGKDVGGFYTPFNGIAIPSTEEERLEAREEAISYAAYRLLSHRYSEDYIPNASTGAPENPALMQALFDDLMAELGYDLAVITTDFSDGNAAALGNYIAEQIIAFGIQDGSNESGFHQNQYYLPTNLGILIADQPGNPTLEDPNRWQRLFQTQDQGQQFIDPNFLSPEWGNVTPAVLSEDDQVIYERDENFYKVYCDPGNPPYIDQETDELGLDDMYKKGFMMVAVWSSLLDPENPTMVDISPNSIGNISSYPENFSEYDDFYNFFTGDDGSEGYDLNPATGEPYAEQQVPLADYGRVLAEFWADGPDSETPPGHWFTILNYVNDHPDLVKKWNGQGDLVDDLEWDVKTYFSLGATMHDCAIAAWGVKGWYDYIRPISAIRYMADQGQSTDMSLPNYSPSGLPLVEGLSELVDLEDPLIGVSQENLDKIKIWAWKGPDYLDEIDSDGELIEPVQDSLVAGVGWILAENWWPYQRPTFITPPFAGYVSGHSTFSRGAAELLADITGDEYFPGGMGVFPCPQNNFLVFEEGPSVDMELQWAKYVDASDQCSLSRIFGGIHPPADDIPGRVIGQKIGEDVYSYATDLLFNDEPRVLSNTISDELINDAYTPSDFTITVTYNREMDPSSTPTIVFTEDVSQTLSETGSSWESASVFQWTYSTTDLNQFNENVGFTVSGATDTEGTVQTDYVISDRLTIDTENPNLVDVSNVSAINEAANGTFAELTFQFSEEMSSGAALISFANEDPTINSLAPSNNIMWNSNFTAFTESYLVSDADEELYDITASVSGLTDAAGNIMVTEEIETSMVVDTKAPTIISVSSSDLYVNEESVGMSGFSISVVFDDTMNPNQPPSLSFPLENPGATLMLNEVSSNWLNPAEYQFVYDVIDEDLEINNIDTEVIGGIDDVGNAAGFSQDLDVFNIDTKAPEVSSITDFGTLITDTETGDQLLYGLEFSEEMTTETDPQIDFSPAITSLMFNDGVWPTGTLHLTTYDVVDGNEEANEILITTSEATDLAGNSLEINEAISDLEIDNKNPCPLVTANVYDVTEDNTGVFQIIAAFDSELNTDLEPTLVFPVEDPSSSLTFNSDDSGWFGSSYIFSYVIEEDLEALGFIDIEFQNVEDVNGNTICQPTFVDFFSIELDTFLNVMELEDLKLVVYPNPVTRGELITVNTDKLINPVFQLIDNSGRLVLIDLEEDGKLDSSNLAAGEYYLRIVDGEKSYILRLVVID